MKKKSLPGILSFARTSRDRIRLSALLNSMVLDCLYKKLKGVIAPRSSIVPFQLHFSHLFRVSDRPQPGMEEEEEEEDHTSSPPTAAANLTSSQEQANQVWIFPGRSRRTQREGEGFLKYIELGGLVCVCEDESTFKARPAREANAWYNAVFPSEQIFRPGCYV